MIHYEHPDDSAYCLCGHICTRNDPQTTTGNNVDCLTCLMMEEAGKKADL